MTTFERNVKGLLGTKLGMTQVWDENNRVVIIEFPSMERLEAWYRSPEYAPALALRKRCAVSHLVMTEGVHDR